jgi:hypothetical protein
MMHKLKICIDPFPSYAHCKDGAWSAAFSEVHFAPGIQGKLCRIFLFQMYKSREQGFCGDTSCWSNKEILIKAG